MFPIILLFPFQRKLSFHILLIIKLTILLLFADKIIFVHFYSHFVMTYKIAKFYILFQDIFILQ